MDDAVRWGVHELRRLCPEKEFGTHTVARHIVRAGLAISRSTVQRVLREVKPPRPPRRPRPAMAKPVGAEPRHLLRPSQPNRVWHMDITLIRILWLRFHVAAILDGFSRKLLCFRVYVRTPNRNLMSLVRDTAGEHGTPRFLITDHGTQFGRRFHAGIGRLGMTHVRGRVRAPYLSGKMERAFRTFRVWRRLVLCGLTRRSMQRRLDDYRHWYNNHRPHSALSGMTRIAAHPMNRLAELLPDRWQKNLATPA